MPCTAIVGCVSPLTCTSASTSQCSQCAAGRYLAEGSVDSCPPCTPIPGCTSPITCTNAADSLCPESSTSTTTSPTTTTAIAVTTTTVLSPTTTTTLPTSLDRFNCYKVRDLRNPHFVPRNDVSLTDQFGTTTVDVRKPYLLCAPASQDGSAVSNPSTHLCCYRTRAPGLGSPARAETTDVFGSLQVIVRRSSLVCEPCSKTLLP